MRGITRYTAVFLFASILHGCASGTGGRIMIADDVRYPALSSAALVEELSITRNIVIHRDATSEQFLLQMETGKDRLAVVAMTGFGQKLFQLQYVQERLTIDTVPFSRLSLTPEELFADLQLIYWPAEELRKLFAGPRVVFSETHNPYTRTIVLDGEPAIEIRYSKESFIDSDIFFRRLNRGYEIRISATGGKAS